MAGALAGIRIVDLTAVVLGPYGMMQLGDQGADIVKIEPPEGEILRHIGPSRHSPGMGPTHLAINRNKRSVALDLKRPEARAALLRIVEGADAFVHAMRPQAMEALGLSYEQVRAVNPDIVYVGAYGFSAKGPYGSRPAYDDVIQAMSGVAWLLGRHNEAPRYAPTIIADKTVGMMLANAVLTALIHKLRTGRGQLVEVPMFETMAQYLMVEHLWMRTFVAAEGEKPGDVGYDRMLTPLRKPFRTRDGYLCILPYTDRHWKRFFDIAGRPDLAADPRFVTVSGRTRHIEALYAEVEKAAAARSNAEWLAALDAASVPCAPVLSLEELIEDPHLKAVGLFETRRHPTEGDILTVNPPVGFTATPGEVRRPAPLLGEHTREVLAEAGLAPAEIEALVQAGAAVAAA